MPSNRSFDLDLVDNINFIETLKCTLLSKTAELFEAMKNSEEAANDKKSILSDILLTNYLLASMIGVSFKELDDDALRKLRLCDLDGLKADKSRLLLEHLKKHNTGGFL